MIAASTTVHRYVGDPGEQIRSGANLIEGGDDHRDLSQNRVSTDPKEEDLLLFLFLF